MAQTSCSADTIDVPCRGIWSRHGWGRGSSRALSLLAILCLAVIALATPQQAQAQVSCPAAPDGSAVTASADTGSCAVNSGALTANSVLVQNGLSSTVINVGVVGGSPSVASWTCSGAGCPSANGAGTTIICNAASGAGACDIGLSWTDSIGAVSTSFLIPSGSSTIPAFTVSGGAYTDSTAPTVTVNIVDASLNDSDNSSNVTFTFDEAVNGFVEGDLTVVGGSISNFSFTDGNTSGSATFTADDNSTTAGSVTVNANSYADGVGNLGATGSDTVTIDTENPTVTVDIVDAGLSNIDKTSNVTFTFSENVTGFTSSDLLDVGGVVSNFMFVDGTASGTATFTGGDNLNGNALLRVNAGSYTDSAGNAGAQGSDNVAVDTTNPTVTVNIVDTSLSDADNSSNVTINFSSAVTSFDESDLVVVGGVISNFSFLDFQASATATFTANDNSLTPGSVTINAGSYVEHPEGNLGEAGSDTVTVDTENPLFDNILLHNGTVTPTNADLLYFLFVFSENMDGTTITADDFMVSGTTADFGVNQITPTTYDLQLANGDLDNLNGTVTVGLKPTASITDAAGNLLLSTTPGGTTNNTVQVQNDAAAPVIQSIIAQSSFPGTQIFKVTFDEVTNNVVGSNFDLITTGTATGTITPGAGPSLIGGGPTEYLIEVTNVSGEGTTTINAKTPNTMSDAAGNTGVAPIASPGVFTLDTTAPRIVSFRRGDRSSVSGVPLTNPTDSDLLQWYITFSEPVTTVMNSDMTVTGTTASVIVSPIDASNLDVNVIGGDLDNLNGTVTLAFAPGQTIQDLAGNPLTDLTPTGTNEPTFTVINDSTPPTVTSVQVPTDGSYGPGKGLQFFVGFDEAVTVSGSPQLPLMIGHNIRQATLQSGSGSTSLEFLYSVVAGEDDTDGIGVGALDLNGGTIKDAAGNDANLTLNNLPSTANVLVDTTAPSYTVTQPLTHDGMTPFQVNLNFNEVMDGLNLKSPSQILSTNATLDSLVTGNGTSSVFTLNFTPTSAADVMITFPSNLAFDLANNRSSNPQQTLTIQYQPADTTPPDVSISSSASGLVNGPFDVKFAFSEDVSGFAIGDIAVGNGAASNFVQTNAAAYSATITPSGDGLITVDVPAGAAQDAVGNNSTAAEQFSVTQDTTPPTVTSSSPPAVVNGPFDLVFNFSEDMTGLTADDFNVTNGTVVLTGGPRNFTVTITPDGNGDISVNLPADSAFDPAGNGNEAFNANFNVEFDNTPPTVTASTPPAVVNGPFDLVFNFTEDMAGLTADDFNVTNGTVVLTGGPRDFTVTIAPDGNGDISVNLPANSAFDSAGNGNEAFNATFSVEFDNTPPTVTASTPPAVVNGPFDLVFNFTEDMAGLTADDFNVTNGTVVLTGGPRDFTVTIAPDGNGDISVNLPANSAFDPAGNGNEAFNANFSVEFDNTPPTVTASTPPAAVNGPFDLVFSFTEDMAGLTADDFNVTNGTVVLTGGPRNFTVTITPDGNGDISVNLPANVAFDPAGNGNEAFVASFTVVVDKEPPSVILSRSSATIVTDPFDVTITFSEDVNGFIQSDLSVTNGSVTAFQSVSASVYTATIAPSMDGVVLIAVAASVAEDAVGNPNAAAESLSVEVDQTPPTVTLSSESSEVTGPFTVTISFSEAVDGFEQSDLSVTNGALSDFAGSGTLFTVLVTPETLGEVSVSVADASASDTAGNNLVGGTLSVTASGGDAEVELEVTTTTVNPGDVGAAFTLSNPGTAPLSFTATADQPWVDVNPSSGQIGSLSDLQFEITLNNQIDDLPPGTYVATVTVQVDDPAATKPGASGASQNTAGLVLATVPITVEVEERFGSFELVVLSSATGPTAGASFSYTSDIAEVDGLSVAASAGETRARIDQLLNGSYEITQSLPEGWRLESVSCSGDTDGGTVVDPVSGKIDVDLDPDESLSCVFENARDDDAIRLATQRAIRNFMARRGDRLLEAAPDLSTRFTERKSQEGGSFSANGSALRTQMDFRTSLAGFRNRAQANAVGDNVDLTTPVLEGWDVWVGAEYSRVEDERVGSGVDAKFFAAQLGADYQVKDNLLVGGLIQYDWMSEDDDELAEGVGAVAGAQVEGDGFMVGPYVVWQATDTLVLDAMGLWGTSDNTVNPLGYYEDEFETTRFLLRANATGEFKHGSWTVRPQLTWSHYEDEQDAYIDTLGIDIPSQTVSIGRLRAGPEVTWTQSADDGAQLELGAAIRANWDYDGPGLLDQTGRLSNGGSDLRADGDLLLGLRFTNGASLRARVGVDGIGKGDFDAKSGRLEFNFPFGGKGGGGVAADADKAFQALDMAMGHNESRRSEWEDHQRRAFY